MGEIHSWKSKYEPRHVDMGSPPLVEAQTITTTVSPAVPPVPSSSDCHEGWQDWTPGSLRSTSTTTVTTTASVVSPNPSPSTQSSPTSTNAAQSTVTSGIAAPPSIISPSFFPPPPAVNTSSCVARTTSSMSGPYNNGTESPLNGTKNTGYFGFNVVNQRPYDPSDKTQAGMFKTPQDWETAFALLKQSFPLMNTIRMYSTTDGTVMHLMNAMPAAQRNELMILAGVWSGTPERFETEKNALKDVVVQYGCGNIAAISVGNEDLNSVNINYASDTDEAKDALKAAMAYTLVNQIGQIRNMTRSLGCCNVPITHTDTWNEFTNTSKSYIPDLINACDEAAIVNIFPYWSESSIENSPKDLGTQYYQAQDSIRQYGKDIWLGETGWAKSQPSNVAPFNAYGTNISDAQQYFDQGGCSILSGVHGSAFYYGDWDEDAPSYGRPAFGLFSYQGEPILNISDCTASQLKLIGHGSEFSSISLNVNHR